MNLGDMAFISDPDIDFHFDSIKPLFPLYYSFTGSRSMLVEKSF